MTTQNKKVKDKNDSIHLRLNKHAADLLRKHAEAERIPMSKFASGMIIKLLDPNFILNRNLRDLAPQLLDLENLSQMIDIASDRIELDPHILAAHNAIIDFVLAMNPILKKVQDEDHGPSNNNDSLFVF